MKLGIIQNTLMAMVLAITVLMVFDRWDNSSTASQLFILQREVEEQYSKSSSRLEYKINRVSDLSDSYQINTTNKITTIESKLEETEKTLKSLELKLKELEKEKQ